MKKIFVFFIIFIFLLLQVTAEEYITHTLKKGETVWRVSKNYNVPLDSICNLNNIKDVTKVSAGTKIKIPSTNSSVNNEKSNTSYKVHILKKGETIWRISKNYNVSVKDLCRINNIKDITKIKSKTKIKIPTKNEYIEYHLPLEGEINLFKTSHFNGLHIFTEEDISKRKVTAIDNGFVSYIDNIPGYGTTVFIKHKNGLLSTYSGLETINVKNGEEISQNQVIGLAGNLSRYNKYGILFSIQQKGNGLEYDLQEKKFIKNQG